MKKTIGYGFKLSGESMGHALKIYEGMFMKTKKEVQHDIRQAKKIGEISKNARPRIFKVVMELQK